MRLTIAALLLTLTSTNLPAQNRFEVASVKPAAPQPPMYTNAAFLRGGPGTNDPGQLSWTNLTLDHVIRTAYDLQEYQLVGPGW